MTMTKVISILNYKGGVAKTTTAANLGTALWIMGKKVLLIDTDIQCNLSYLLDFDQTEGDNTLHEWLLNDCEPPVFQRYDGLYFIPSKKDVYFEEKLGKCYHQEDVLRDHLNTIKGHFDYVLIDCSPKEGLVNTNAMCASDSLLIPVECSSFSMQGMQSLMDSIERVKKRMNPDLSLEGLLIVKYDKTTRISRDVSEYFAETYPDDLMKTRIRKNVRFDESPILHKTCFEVNIGANGAEDYMTLAEEMTGEKRPEDWKKKVLTAWLNDHPEDGDVIKQLNDLNKQ